MSEKNVPATPRVLFVTAYLPWDRVRSDENPARVLVVFALLLSLLMLFVIQRIQLPEVDRAQAEKLPERLAKLVEERKPEPPPPPPPPEEKPEEAAEEEPQAKPEQPTEQQVQQARDKAEKALSEAKAELAALQDLASSFDFGADQPLTKSGAQSAGVSRDLIASRSGKGSGGVNIGTASSGGGGAGVAGGGKLAQAQMAKVESNISEGPTGAVRKTASGKLERTQEEVRRIMDRNNGALQAIYQRALRSNPTLKGAVVLRIVIEANGSVSRCEIVSSELNDAETEQKLVTRIRAINFGAIDGVAVWDDNYTLNFFPS